MRFKMIKANNLNKKLLKVRDFFKQLKKMFFNEKLQKMIITHKKR